MNSVNIRLQLGIISDPPVGPIDLLTEASPKAWRGASLAVDLGIFQPNGAAVDLSDLDFLEVDIFPAAIFNQLPGTNFTYNRYSVSPYPNLPPAPLQFVTILAADITATIQRDEWVAGNAQQATAEFTFEQMQALQLDGKQSKDFWIVVSGLTAAKKRLVYGGSRLTVYDPAAQGIYLPNNLAPLVVPEDTILYIPPNQQMTYSLPIDDEGTIVCDGVLIQV